MLYFIKSNQQFHHTNRIKEEEELEILLFLPLLFLVEENGFSGVETNRKTKDNRKRRENSF
jgi:hypothetical protein